MAFPGGRLDGGEGVVAGALREAFEEVGLDPGLVTVVGQLTAMPTVSSNTVMTPVRGAPSRPVPRSSPTPREVERVFDVALSDLVADGAFHEEWWSVPGPPRGTGLPRRRVPGVVLRRGRGDRVGSDGPDAGRAALPRSSGWTRSPPSLTAASAALRLPGRTAGRTRAARPGGIVGSSRSARCRSCRRSEVRTNCDQGPEGIDVAELEIGIFKSGRRAYGLDDIAIVPSRRTRDPEDVDISWEIDAYRFELPLMASAMDGVVSPSTAIEIGRLGGLGVLNLEGLWTRYEDPTPLFDEIRELPVEKATARMQQMYAEPVQLDLVTAADQGDEGGRHHHRGLGDPAEDRVVRRRPCWPPSSTCWSSRGPWSRPSTSRRRWSRSTSSGSSASSRSR